MNDLQEFADYLGKVGRDISASRYDAITDPDKPQRRTLFRKYKLPWRELKDRALSDEPLSYSDPSEHPAWRIPKILTFDIETSPCEFYAWGTYKQRIPIDNLIKEWAVLSWSAKWLFNPDVMGEVVTPKQARNREDKSIIKSIWNLINEADIIVAHNGKRFDIRKLNARFIVNGLKPPLPYRMVDTLEHSRKIGAFTSHKLNYLGQLLRNDEKIHTDFRLWKACVGKYGSDEAQKALNKMLRYNLKDSTLLEDVYLEIRPWVKSHPNCALYFDTIETISCPNCNCPSITWDGHYVTAAGKFEAFRCDDCGAIGRSRYSCIDREDRKKYGVSVAG